MKESPSMLNSGVDTSVIMAISGHRTMAMFKRYNRIDLDDGRDAMRKLEIYLSEDLGAWIQFDAGIHRICRIYRDPLCDH